MLVSFEWIVLYLLGSDIRIKIFQSLEGFSLKVWVYQSCRLRCL